MAATKLNPAQTRLKAEIDSKGYVNLSGRGEFAAARALERRGLIKLDSGSGSQRGPKVKRSAELVAWKID